MIALPPLAVAALSTTALVLLLAHRRANLGGAATATFVVAAVAYGWLRSTAIGLLSAAARTDTPYRIVTPLVAAGGVPLQELVGWVSAVALAGYVADRLLRRLGRAADAWDTALVAGFAMAAICLAVESAAVTAGWWSWSLRPPGHRAAVFPGDRAARLGLRRLRLPAAVRALASPRATGRTHRRPLVLSAPSGGSCPDGAGRDGAAVRRFRSGPCRADRCGRSARLRTGQPERGQPVAGFGRRALAASGARRRRPDRADDGDPARDAARVAPVVDRPAARRGDPRRGDREDSGRGRPRREAALSACGLDLPRVFAGGLFLRLPEALRARDFEQLVGRGVRDLAAGDLAAARTQLPPRSPAAPGMRTSAGCSDGRSSRPATAPPRASTSKRPSPPARRPSKRRAISRCSICWKGGAETRRRSSRSAAR